jgi:hypothetical protein
MLPLRPALENSRSLATAHLLKGGIEDKPEASPERLCQLALEARIYSQCLHLYPFVLGGEPVRPVDRAAFCTAAPTGPQFKWKLTPTRAICPLKRVVDCGLTTEVGPSPGMLLVVTRGLSA